MIAGNTRAASYVRVSTAGQANDGLSLADQSKRIREFVADNGWQLVAEYEDAGKSATKSFLTRPEFLRMLSDASAGKFDTLVIYDMTRFSRNPSDYFLISGQLDALNISIVTLDNPNFNSADSGQVLGREIQVVVGKFTAKQAKDKSTNVKHSKLLRGEYNLGQRIPYGLKWTDKAGHRLEHDPKTYPVWSMIKHLRRMGWSYQRIADGLNGDGVVEKEITDKFRVTLPVPNRYGRKIWRNGAIASMFKDEQRVTGVLKIDFKKADGKVQRFEVEFPPLMTRSEFEKFGKLSAKALTWIPRSVGKGAVLSGVGRCGVCGAKLHVTGSRGYQYYGCANRLRPAKGQKRCSLPLIPMIRMEKKVWWMLSEFLQNEERFKEALAAANITQKNTQAELSKITQQEKQNKKAMEKSLIKSERVIDLYTDNIITKAELVKKRQALASEQDRLTQQADDLAARRLVLQRQAGDTCEIEAARKKLIRRYGPVQGLIQLTKDDQQSLLRSLVPPDSDDCAIVVHRTGEEYLEEVGEKWYAEFRGVVPVECSKLKHAVLGGALAVP